MMKFQQFPQRSFKTTQINKEDSLITLKTGNKRVESNSKQGQAFNLPLKNKNTGMVPWDYQIEDEKYQKEPWILKKEKEYVTIEKDNNNKG